MEVVEEIIPIRESVRQLDEKFPHLREVTWNDREDRRARFQKRLEEKEQRDKENVQLESSNAGGNVGQGCGIEAYSERKDGIEVISGYGALVQGWLWGMEEEYNVA